MNPQVQKELRVLEKRLQESNIPIDTNLKKRVYEILSDIQYDAFQGKYPMPGMLIVLGYDPNNPVHSNYYFESDQIQNITQRRVKLKEISETESISDQAKEYLTIEKARVPIRENVAEEIINLTKYFDGAILVNPDGYITDIGILLMKMDPTAVLEEMGIGNDHDLSERFGFIDKVHARHFTAICASYLIPNTTVYTLSKKTGLIRIFEIGKILYSQKEGEPKILEPQEPIVQTSGALNLNQVA